MLIDGLLVGYFSRGFAVFVSTQLGKNGYRGLDASCEAMIIGGHGQDEAGVLIGVRLDMYADLLSPPESCEPIEGSEFSFSTTGADSDLEDRLAYIGNTVNFWSPQGNPSVIYVFCRGGICGEGKLGTVPSQHLMAIRRHLDAGLDYQAVISSRYGADWKIDCRLLSAEECNDQIEQFKVTRRLQLTGKLAKPYRPRKPVIVKMYLPISSLRRGDTVLILALPTLEDLVSSHEANKINFRCERNKFSFIHAIESETLYKLIRLSNMHKNITVLVKSIRRYYDDTGCFSFEVQV